MKITPVAEESGTDGVATREDNGATRDEVSEFVSSPRTKNEKGD